MSSGSVLSEKRILLGVSGGIAAYKAAEVVRSAMRAGAEVRVILTSGGARFVTALTFQALTQNPVSTNLFDPGQEQEIGHIDLADWADLLLIAPATANVIARLAMGMADDLLTTVALATRAPLVLAPAMNVHMYRHAAVQRNIKELRNGGAHVVDPAEGEMACGHVGEGRLADTEDILDGAARAISTQDLSGVALLVTAGPTEEPIDPVRVISNRSSGKMGYALARAAWRRGADVTLISGPVDPGLRVPRGVRLRRVETALEMGDAVLEHYPKASVVVMAAAVADWTPDSVSSLKIKKGEGNLRLDLKQTRDILSQLGRAKGDRLLVGFAAETDRVIENARKKLEGKNLDLVVANDVTVDGAGFGVDTNQVVILDRDGTERPLPLLSKERTADAILDSVSALLSPRARS
ncbi:MAG: bifunctional phosphopantothenoylcysteine decarboxylase/phosphopantothenate--cysteine ligase CoaBC [Deltaproteobacteria bacterium]|nr:bifunctional phosphopantothenoylcysteine decarboxylase/phosphopantothenate--cysteine ligase CoaBC [Deltaproteobacteria bacterium]